MQTVMTPATATTPVYIVSLLRYKEYADYGNAAGSGPCSGREIYFQRYVRAFKEITAAEQVTLFFLGRVLAGWMVPEGEQWDEVVVTQYPDLSSFRRITQSAEYLTMAKPHLDAALDNYRIIVTGGVK
ncbi:DUF1330 domain-containing protein [Chitinophaga rupis]|nr:DUF1330 domain-containing protein [Chitinophaga rupis]